LKRKKQRNFYSFLVFQSGGIGIRDGRMIDGERPADNAAPLRPAALR
jgi:hypothetical protein